MFDTDDSLVWQRPGLKKNKNGGYNSPNLQQENAKSFHHYLNSSSAKGTPPFCHISGLSGEENSPNLVKGTDKFPSGNRSNSNIAEHFPKSQTSSDNMWGSAIPKKQYNPMLYSPSHRMLEKNPTEAQSNLVKYTNLPAAKSENICKSPLVSNNIHVEADGEAIYNKTVSGVKKGVHFGNIVTSSSEPVTRLEFIPELTSVSLRESYNNVGPPHGSQSEVGAFNTRVDIQPNIRFANVSQEPHKSIVKVPNTIFKDSHFDNVYRGKELATNTLAGGYSHQSYTQPYCPPSYQPSSVGKDVKPIDSNVYQLIEDQNRHIIKLYETLETFLKKKGSDDAKDNNSKKDGSVHQKRNDQACNCSYRHVSTQTVTSNNANLQSVGTNTDISWPDLLSTIKQNEQPSSDTGAIRLPAMQKENNEEDSPAVKERFLNGRHRRVSDLKKTGSERKEISFTMREVVMASIQEYQPSPEPSLHINMEDYKDASEYEAYNEESRVPSDAGDCTSSPDQGERVSFCDRNNSPYPQHNHHQESQNIVPSPGNPPTNTFYNNVMANIQQILQNSRSADDDDGEEAEEEVETRKQRLHNKAEQQQHSSQQEELHDPQVEAIRHQLSQFGVSCIDPASFVPGHRPVPDTFCLPGVHNMLSVYQSTIVSPYRPGFKESVVAKYMTDMQLATIASRSTAMRNLNLKATGARERELSAAPDPSSRFGVPDYLSSGKEYSSYDDNLSIATKNFLGKYGLGGNE
ncbi:uncharacterized protein LOC135198683 [Macrobrachium nipponense]|uniref:uncharacterized protein LOC135198683 n=1 Tax=Macrobrachium nipponense TaxID=159736 RepID=UPI0030C7FD6E